MTFRTSNQNRAKGLIALAIDVSGSMQRSIRSTSDEMSRMEGFQHAIEQLMQQAQETLQSQRALAEDTLVCLFMYGFGFLPTNMEVLDILSIVKAAQELALDDDEEQGPAQSNVMIRQSENIADAFDRLEHIARQHRQRGWDKWAQRHINAEQASVLVRHLEVSPLHASYLADLLSIYVRLNVGRGKLLKYLYILASIPINAATRGKKKGWLRRIAQYSSRPHLILQEQTVNLHRAVMLVSDLSNHDSSFGELERIAAQHDRCAWSLWTRQFINSQQARHLVQKFRTNPTIAQQLANLLPKYAVRPNRESVQSENEAAVGDEAKKLVLELVIQRAGYGDLKRIADKYHLSWGKWIRHFISAEQAGELARQLEANPFDARRLLTQYLPLTLVQGVLSGRAGDRQALLLPMLNHIGDTTLSLSEVVELWNTSTLSREDIRRDIDRLIYGETPMRKALTTIRNRFEREWAKQAVRSSSLLFVLSDGEPSDGNPLPLAKSLQADGVTIIACFMTDEDITQPRVLYGRPNKQWRAGAQLMFNMASEAANAAPFVHFLVKRGWTVEPGAKLFVQVNHSEILEEFVQGLLVFLEEAEADELPRGR